MAKIDSTRHGWRYRCIGRSPAPVLTLLALVLCASASSEPLLLPGDAGLRADLQLLADAGLLEMPLSVWPLPRAAIASQLSSAAPPAQWQDYLQQAWLRVTQRLQVEPRALIGIVALDEAIGLRRFDAVPRGAGLRATVHRDVGPLTFNLRAAINDPATGTREELDGSYIGLRWRNWLLSAGAVPRWWGPGHDSSLILSTNARPVPALALDSLAPIRFDARWLRWLGSIHLSAFAGALEQHRAIGDARLLGGRLTLRPVPTVEIGLSRTAQWGGTGRPENLKSLVNLLLGRDNRGDAGITLASEPGNQLGGIDLRWGPIGGRPYAVYTQWIGEDEAGGLPSRLIALAGAEHWRAAPGGYQRWYGEIADTTIEFYKSKDRPNLAYEHFIYRDGYRFRGRVIGHAMDNDGLMISVGMLRQGARGDWRIVARRIAVNRDGRDSVGAHTVAPLGEDRWELILGVGRQLWGGQLDWGASLAYIDPNRASTRLDSRGYAAWQRSF